MKIVLSVVLAMLIAGCSEDKGTQKSAEKSVAPQSVEKVVQSVEKPKAVAVVEKKVAVEKKEVVTPVENVVKKQVEKKIEKSVTTASVDGAKLFKVCSSCHGVNAEKKALGKSQVIKGWDKAKIVTALHGYKDGTYGGPMKAVMKGQASKLSEDEIKALADYISKL